MCVFVVFVFFRFSLLCLASVFGAVYPCVILCVLSSPCWRLVRCNSLAFFCSRRAGGTAGAFLDVSEVFLFFSCSCRRWSFITACVVQMARTRPGYSVAGASEGLAAGCAVVPLQT